MADTSNLFTTDKPYATAADSAGIAQPCQIEAAGVDEYDGQSFAWIKVDAVEKPIRLNKTNGRGLVVFGQDTDQWVGKPVFVTTRDGKFDDGRSWTGWVISPINAAPTQPAANNKPQPDNNKPFDDAIPL